tara:strand:- start:8851 stop:9519 length:669 start_codon:yes stop_codon:yes gene_type:complete
MMKFNLPIIFFSVLLVSISSLFAEVITDQRELKNKIHNFSSKNIDADMSTKWSLTGLYLEKYNDNYTFIKNPKLKLFNSNLVTNISSETAIDAAGNMDEIFLKSNVFINRNNTYTGNNIRLYTSYAIFYLPKNLIETNQDVTIITSDSTTTGNGLSANLDTGLITILSDAKRVVRDGGELQTIKGNQMIYNTKTEKWIVKNKSANELKRNIENKVTTTFNLK